MRRNRCGGALVPPSETTIRRALASTDAGALDERLRTWNAAASLPSHDAGVQPAGDLGMVPPVRS